jgi:hypothetical protein
MTNTEPISAELEEEKARQLVAEVSLPPEIVKVDIRSGNDWSGDPALWVTLWVRDDLEFSQQIADRLNNAAKEVRFKLIGAQFSRFPYITLDQAA